MATTIAVSVQTDDFTHQSLLAPLTACSGEAGAQVTFVGQVRGSGTLGTLDALELEHYPGMTEKALDAIAQQAVTRWGVMGVSIIHRVGRLIPGANIVGVAVVSAHRQAAFEAASFVMDYLKTEAPFWKKEISGDRSLWVAAKASDQQARERWA